MISQSLRLRRAGHVLFLCAGIAGVSLAGCQEDATYKYSVDRKTVDGLPTVTATENAKSKATVDAIDYGNRSIALTGPAGKTEIFYVSQAVRNFYQIKKGDTVNVEYSGRMFVSVRKVGDMPTVKMRGTVDRADPGEKPGITCTRQVVIEANVESIDYTTRVVKLRPLVGNVMTLTADPKLKDLDKVHVGDQVVFDYTESITIGVD